MIYDMSRGISFPLQAQTVECCSKGIPERSLHPGEVEPAEVQSQLLHVNSRVVSIYNQVIGRQLTWNMPLWPVG